MNFFECNFYLILFSLLVGCSICDVEVVDWIIFWGVERLVLGFLVLLGIFFMSFFS